MSNAQINSVWFKMNDRIVTLLMARAGATCKVERSRLEFLIDGLRARRAVFGAQLTVIKG